MSAERRKQKSALRKAKFELSQREAELKTREKPATPGEAVTKQELHRMRAWRDALKKYVTSLEAGKNVDKPVFKEVTARASKEFTGKKETVSGKQGRPNAYWAKVRELQKGGASESQAKTRAEKIMKEQDSLITLDSLLLKNQPIAKEGILSYKDGMKLKRWEDLKRNIGRIVPILDEHPSIKNGNNGLVTAADKHFGKATIKQCRDKKRLCADLDLDDDAPVKKGFSIGFPFEQLNEPGIHDGNRYDSIQANLVIDHLALTNHPRDTEELMITGDVKYYFVGDSEGKITQKITQNNTLNNTLININAIAYDSIEFTGVEKQREIRDLARKLKRDNPETTASDEDLLERARIMLENEQELNKQDVNNMIQGTDAAVVTEKPEMTEEEKEEEKTKRAKRAGDSDYIDLVKRNAELEAKIAALDSAEDLKIKLKNAQDALDAKKKIINEYHQKELKSDIDSLINDHEFKSEDFDGKTPDFVAGALFAAKNLSEGPNNGKKITEIDSKEDLRYGRDGYSPGRWSYKLGKYVSESEWPGE